MPGVIAEFHEISACHASNYRYFHEWQELEPEQKAKLIAHFLLRGVIESHKNDAQAEDIKRSAKKGKKGG